MNAHDLRNAVESDSSDTHSSMPSRWSAPRSGDVLVSEPTARADVYAISLFPAPAHTFASRYPDAMERVRELVRQMSVDGWYTGDQTHYARVAMYRAS